MTAKLVELNKDYWPRGGLGHFCPACNAGHEIDVDAPNASGAIWKFNGHLRKPTFTPSVNLIINPKDHKHYQSDLPIEVCHYFITGGYIQYLRDCTHAMRDRTIELPEVPSHIFASCRRLG